MTGSDSKKALTLLGIWNILPAAQWVWLNDACVDKLRLLTGRKLGLFWYVKGDLDYECFVKGDADLLKSDLDKLTPAEQLQYVKKLTDDYYAEVKFLEERMKFADSQDYSSLDNKELASHIDKLGTAWSQVTMQIWYALLLDIWYPSPKDKVGLKEIIAKARDHCGHLHEQSDKIERRIYSETAKRLNISEREVYFMIQPEIIGALSGTKLSREKLQSRMKLCVGSNHEGALKVYEGEEAVEVMKGFVAPSIGEKKEGDLKGTPACLGKIRGTAHVILLDSEFKDFKEGEILVSLQTMVHYIPVMKKAKAILTEFGGLTSHAAIVSRELKKPCVVGIKGLISSIKSGDMIEVDADRGVVRKL